MKEFSHISQLQPVELLRALSKERSKFTNADRDYMSALVNKLVELGVYPSYGFNGRYSALSMVEYYGVDWHQFSTPHYCPECGSDLRDWEAGVPGKREVLIKPADYYVCPDCEKDITSACQQGKHRLLEK